MCSVPPLRRVSSPSWPEHFAALALLLAAIGVYGVVSYSVSRRMHEMGVRMALGATSPEILLLVMREAMGLASAGILLGTAAAFFVSRTLRSLIYGVSAIDPATYSVAIAVIALATFLGCWRPAAQAASANPIDALRSSSPVGRMPSCGGLPTRLFPPPMR